MADQDIFAHLPSADAEAPEPDIFGHLPDAQGRERMTASERAEHPSGEDMTPLAASRPSIQERINVPFREALTGPNTVSAAARRYFSQSPFNTMNLVNQAVVGPLATTFVDLPNAIVRGAAGAVGGVGEKMGLSPSSSERLERDMNVMGDVAGIVAGSELTSEHGAVPAGTVRAPSALGAAPAESVPMGTILAASKVQRRIEAAEAVPKKAADVVGKRLQQEISQGGTTAQSVLDKLNKARALGKPMTLPDVGAQGGPVRGLAGTVARHPGPSQATMAGFYEGRDVAAPERLVSDVGRDLGSGPSRYRTANVLLDERASESAPLYAKAMEGGSLAPLEKQFESAFNEASRAEVDAGKRVTSAQTRVTAAQARLTQTGGDIYSESGAREELRAANSDLAAASRERDNASYKKQLTVDQMTQAQEDIAQNRPGAVWTPFIQQIMDDPITKAGISRGLELERLDALHNRTRFDPTEFSIVGQNADGSPIVGKVPNMRLLDAAKKGMDAIIAEERLPNGRLSARGRAVNLVRRDLLKEIDAINPDYAVARAAWSGKSASLDSINWGRSVADHLNSVGKGFSDEEISDHLTEMVPNDVEFARLGLADGLLAKIKTAGFGGDEAKRIIKSEWSKGQLKPFFKTETDYQNFVESVGIERGMFDARQEIMRGSQTAGRVVEDAQSPEASVALHGTQAALHLFQRNPVGFARSLYNAARDYRSRNDTELNQAIAKILTDTSVRPNLGPEGQIIIPPRLADVAAQLGSSKQ